MEEKKPPNAPETGDESKRDAGLHHKHRARVTARFLKEGPAGFEPHQLLELLLFFAIPRKDTNPLAHRLINEFGSLQNVLHADYGALCRVEGVGPSTALLICVARAGFQTAAADDKRVPVVSLSRSHCESYLRPYLQNLDHEKVYVLYFNARNRLIRHTLVAEGSHNRAVVNLRAVAVEALDVNAAGIVLAHNHPSREPCFSQEDAELTRSLCRTLCGLGVDVCDHLIFAGDKVISLAEQGVLRDIKRELQRPATQFLPDRGDL